MVLILAIGVTYVWYPKTSTNPTYNEPSVSTTPTVYEPPAFKAFTDHYMGIMQSLNSTSTKALMAPMLNPGLNQTTLFTWEHSRLTFEGDTNFFENPLNILSSGKGICVQWSIVYVSACLTLGYPCRLVVAADTSTWKFIHTWAEDYYNGTWVHVDPSDSVWNSPSKYQSWPWGQYMGSQVKVYAFEDGAFQDVTATYSSSSS